VQTVSDMFYFWCTTLSILPTRDMTHPADGRRITDLLK
jgi:hypothetical protein